MEQLSKLEMRHLESIDGIDVKDVGQILGVGAQNLVREYNGNEVIKMDKK